MIKAIFWDNDGVLVDTDHLYFLANQKALETVGIHLNQERYIDLFMIQNAGVWRLAAEKGLSSDAVEKLRAKRDALYSDMLDQNNLLIDGVRDVLEILHKKYLMGVVTSSAPDHFALIHQKTGLLPYFQFTLTAGNYTHSKPHPEPYLKAVERSGRKKEECLVIEDSERGLIAAKEAGLSCIVVPNDLTRQCRFDGAQTILKNVREVPRYLEEISSPITNLS